ncbi:hypothetical protein A4H97_32075 [Niastella yeongjuensis]|uniref:Uncharacterized protein n=1 Tax=Niastella yeongjuensis TaxID=354355 RepID=A0A1V9EIC0_9BACT|nr:DUF6266 family protein [Niastella yeongjuensis]OQP45880.1 hypothetical protein A4H97_32075 [Niastella yeongjuensis]SEP46756.1 hypothetical protein SAMN05660816_06497 [Niastella yeongjuensis]
MALQFGLFAFTGTLGNVVGYRYKGKYYLRSRPVRKNRTVTINQLTQQEKFAIAGKFVRCLSPLLAYSLPEPKKMTKSNFVMSHILRNAITGAYPDFKIDYNQVFISRGRLFNAWSEKVSSESGNVTFTWEDNSKHQGGNAKGDDKAILVIYCEALNECIYSIHAINRSSGNATIPVLQFLGHKVETWMGFISADGKLRSDSTYTGTLYIT